MFGTGIDFTLDTRSESLLQMNRAFDDTLKKYNVKTDKIGYKTKRSPSLGVFRSAYDPDRATAIEFQKKFVANPAKASKETHEAFLANKANAIETGKKRVKMWENDEGWVKKGSREYEKYYSEAKNNLKVVESLERWAIYSEDGIDPMYAVAKHESYHAVAHKYNAISVFEQELVERGVKQIDMAKVSEYGASKTSELFAEAGTAVDLGIDIPSSIRKAFEETIKQVVNQ